MHRYFLVFRNVYARRYLSRRRTASECENENMGPAMKVWVAGDVIYTFISVAFTFFAGKNNDEIERISRRRRRQIDEKNKRQEGERDKENI